MMQYQGELFTNEWRPMCPPREISDLQIPLVTTLKTALRPDVLMRHYTAGGCDGRTGAKLKLMGRLAGSADLEFIWREGVTVRMLFIELKLPGRKLSASQVAFRERVRHLGPYCVARTIDEALAALATFRLLSSPACQTQH
jgi:hypothetical protein